MAAGNAAETAILGTGIGQIPRDDGQAVVHFIVAKVVVFGWIIGGVAAMKDERLGTSALGRGAGVLGCRGELGRGAEGLGYRGETTRT